MKRIKLHPGLITDSWELKLTALGLAVLLWAAVRSEDTTRFTMREVPVDVRVADDNWVTTGAPEPAVVSVDFRGPMRELVRLAFAEATLVVPIEDVEDTVELYRPQPEWLEFEGRFENLLVDEIEPAILRLTFEPIVQRNVPVVVQLGSALKPTTRLAGPPQPVPSRVLVEGPRSRVLQLDSLVARIENVEAALRSGAVRVPLDTTGIDLTVVPTEVVVHIRTLPDSVVAPTPDQAQR